MEQCRIIFKGNNTEMNQDNQTDLLENLSEAMNKNSKCYYNSALSLFLPAQYCLALDGFELKLGRKRYFFRGGETPFNNSCSSSIAQNKYCTNKTLEKAGLPVPKSLVIDAEEYQREPLEELMASLTFPLVTKPLANHSLGQGVICNIKTINELKKHLDAQLIAYKFLCIEEFHGQMNSYRVLVFNRRIIGVVQRFPARVLGDGQHTILELMKLTNEIRKKTNDALGPIVADEECHIRLNEQGINFSFIPNQGEIVPLGYACNASRGGTFETLDTNMCQENKKLMIQVADSLGLTLVGIDVECVDINKPIMTSGGVIIEANHNPSVKIHEYPLKGQPNRVTKKIVRALIYRHPFAYLHVLYINRRTAPYMRGLIFLTLMSLTYLLLRLGS